MEFKIEKVHKNLREQYNRGLRTEKEKNVKPLLFITMDEFRILDKLFTQGLILEPVEKGAKVAKKNKS